MPKQKKNSVIDVPADPDTPIDPEATGDLIEEEADVLDDEVETEAEAEPARPASQRPRRKLNAKGMTMEAYCNALAEADWETRQLYVQREGMPDVQDALKKKFNSKYSAILKGPFDDGWSFGPEMIQRQFGGGDFRIILNWRDSPRTDHIEKQCVYSGLEGAPIWQARERQAGIGAEEEEEAEQAAAVAAASDRSLVERLLDKMDEANERVIEAVSTAREPEAKAASGAVEMALQTGTKMVDAMAQRLAQPPGPSVGDKVIEAALSRMLQPAPDPIEQLINLRRAEKAMGGGEEGGMLGQFNQLKSLLDAFGVKFPGGAAADAVADAVTPEPPSAMDRFFDLAGEAMKHGPMVFVQAWIQMKQAQMVFQERQFQMELQRRQHGLAPMPVPSAIPTPGMQPGVGAVPATQPQAHVDPMFDRMTQVIARHFFQGVEPSDTAQTLMDSFPQEMMQVEAGLTSIPEWWKDPRVLQGLAQQFPALSSAVTDPNFSPWLAALWQAWGELRAESAPNTATDQVGEPPENGTQQPVAMSEMPR